MRKLLLLIAISIFLFCSGCFEEKQSWADENGLPKAVLLTTSKACHCTLARCKEAEALLNNVFKSYEGKIEFRKIDYSFNPQEVETMAREYKVFMLPAVLFFGKNGEFKGKLDYQLTEENINKKLKEIEL